MKHINKINTSITEGNIFIQILIFFFPILIGSFFQQLYNTIDAVIVGQYVGKVALAAVGGSTSSIANVFLGFFIGITAGCSIIIAQHYGAGNKELLEKCVHTAITFSFICGLCISITGFLFTKQLLIFTKVSEEIIPQATIYLKYYFLGMIATLVYNMGASILRAVGDSKTPLYFLIFSCFLNIILDVLFVVTLNLGVFGVAIATVLCQAVSAVLVTLKLCFTDKIYKVYINKLGINTFHLKKMIYIGIAAGLQSTTYNLANLFLQSFVNRLDIYTNAAWTAATKIDPIYWLSIQALGLSITTIIGQNYGAGKKERVRKSINISLIIATVMTISMSALILIFMKNALGIFTNDELIINKGTKILTIMSSFYFLYIIIEVYSAALRSVGDCWIPMFISALGICALRIIFVSISFPIYRNMDCIIIAFPFSWFVTSVFYLIYMHKFSFLNKWLKA